MIRSILLLSAISPGALILHGQQSDLGKLRDEHEKAVAASTKMLDDTYRLTLQRLERRCAENGDYEGAMSAKERADAIEKPTGAAAPIAPIAYSLTANQARTQGGVNYDRARDFIEFRKTGAAAIWELLPVEPGSYEAFIIYSAGVPVHDPTGRSLGEPCGGIFAWSEVTNLGTRALPIEKSVVTTGSWENFVRVSLGRHEFKSRSATLRVEALAAAPGGLMRLRRIEIAPLSDSTATSARVVGTMESFRDLQKKNREALLAALTPVREKFAPEFEKLEREFVARGDTQGAAAVARARQNLFPKGDETNRQQ
jgi:hypothetical protein